MDKNEFIRRAKQDHYLVIMWNNEGDHDVVVFESYEKAREHARKLCEACSRPTYIYVLGDAFLPFPLYISTEMLAEDTKEVSPNLPDPARGAF